MGEGAGATNGAYLAHRRNSAGNLDNAIDMTVGEVSQIENENG